MKNEIELSDFQEKVCKIPQKFDLFLGGGRGSGKSYLLAILMLRYAEQYGEDARMLYIRRTHKSLEDFAALCRSLFGKVYGSEIRHNANEGFFKFPNGAYLELNQLQNDTHYLKFQGRSFGLICADEITAHPTPRLIDKLRSNMRGPKDQPTRFIMCGNPGGSGHSWVSRRFVFGNDGPWKPFTEQQSERTFVSCPSTYKSNPFIDQQAYAKNLKASLPNDPELLKAWLEGDWSVARGAYFSTVLDEESNCIDPLPTIPTVSGGFAKMKPGFSAQEHIEHWISFDHGSAAPSVCYIMCKSPGIEIRDQYFPKNSIIIIDELAFYDPNDLTSGLNYTIPHQAELIKEFCEQWEIKPKGVADDACFSKHGHSAGSIAQEFSREGVHFKRAKKGDRKSGWERMRTLMSQAGKPDKPGLYISRSCSYFWETVPYIGRDKRDPSDLDTTGPDHGADAVRYGLGWKKRGSLRPTKVTL